MKFNHDACHCADAVSTCPSSCYRKQLEDDLRENGKGQKWILSYSSLRNTSICPLNETESEASNG